MQIDHVVALSDAWQKGAQGLDAARRTAFANDPLNLLAVDGPLNMPKGDGDAATWLPPNKAYRCAYVARQVAVKVSYGLWMTQAEENAIATVLSSCPDEPLPGGVVAQIPLPAATPVAAPAPAPAPKPAPAPPPRRPRRHRASPTRTAMRPGPREQHPCTSATPATARSSTGTATASAASDSGPPPGTSVPVRRAPDPRSTGHPALGHPTAEEKRPEASRTGAPGPHAHSWEAAVAHIEGEVLIRRPVEEVFDFVADQRTEPTYNSNMQASEKITEGPIDVGTRFRATIRAGRRLLPMDIEYTGLDRPHRIASTTHMSTADFSGS